MDFVSAKRRPKKENGAIEDSHLQKRITGSLGGAYGAWSPRQIDVLEKDAPTEHNHRIRLNKIAFWKLVAE